MITKINLLTGDEATPSGRANNAKYRGKIAMRDTLYTQREPLPVQQQMLELLRSFSYGELVRKSLGEGLSFGEAFAANCYVLRASNGKLANTVLKGLATDSFGEFGDCMAAREMLCGLAMKEAHAQLSEDEVAGLVTAAMLDVVHFPKYGPRVLETCGMGGDLGMLINGDGERRKTINGSTLSALVVASLGHRVSKHGSYSNTSVLGATEAIEELGLVIDIPGRNVQDELADSGFIYTDAHAWKTIHDLSHLPPRRETVNHVIGPMTPPIDHETRLDKVLGVNEKMRPETIAQAYAMLHKNGVFNVGNVAVVAGLSQRIDVHGGVVKSDVRALTVLDELSPFASVVALTSRDKFLGNFVFTPASFGVHFNDPFCVFIENNRHSISSANRSAIMLESSQDRPYLVDYLAMNAALALYLVECMDDDVDLRSGKGPSTKLLQQCFTRCRNAIIEGRSAGFLRKQQELTHRLSAQ